jgi:hypothetical protein
MFKYRNFKNLKLNSCNHKTHAITPTKRALEGLIFTVSVDESVEISVNKVDKVR